MLAVEGIDDAAQIKRARDHEKKARQDAERELKALKEQRKADEEKGRRTAAAGGDVDAILKSADERLAQALAEKENEYKPLISSLESDLDRLLRQTDAQRLAAELAVQGSESVLVLHILSRLGIELRDGNRTSVVLDAAGRPSAMSLNDLKREIANNKAFAPIIAGSRASGGGAGGARGGGAVPGTQLRSRMTIAEKSAYIEAHGKDAYLALPAE